MLTSLTISTALPLLMIVENFIIASCYAIIGSGITYGIWRNRSFGINPVIVTIAAIFYSCALGHSMHSLKLVGLQNAVAWQTISDFITVLVAIRFLTYYESFDILARIGQILADKAELETQNISLKDALSQLKKTQTQLIQAEKMSSLGQLVAGVAHEISNPVNFIHGNLTHIQEYSQRLLDLVQLYQRQYPNPTETIQSASVEIDLDFIQKDFPKILASIKLGIERIQKIVLLLRNFSRMDESELKLVDIHEGIDSTLLLLQHRLKAKSERPAIQIIKDYDNLPYVECYASSLNQVFMNILSNAIDALDEVNANQTCEKMKEKVRQITIRTSVINSQWVQIAIADNGPGMSEAVKDEVFNPFFTTKPVDKGAGLGISISYQIVVEKHGGTLKCSSELGKGSEFWIQIPVKPLIRCI